MLLSSPCLQSFTTFRTLALPIVFSLYGRSGCHSRSWSRAGVGPGSIFKHWSSFSPHLWGCSMLSTPQKAGWLKAGSAAVACTPTGTFCILSTVLPFTQQREGSGSGPYSALPGGANQLAQGVPDGHIIMRTGCPARQHTRVWVRQHVWQAPGAALRIDRPYTSFYPARQASPAVHLGLIKQTSAQP